MAFVQRNDVGEIVGRFANPQPGHAEEWIDDDNPELISLSPSQIADNERAWRDSQLSSVKWLRERHRDQQDIGCPSTLTAGQFQELLVYMQALRDWPQSSYFPEQTLRPMPPDWLSSQTQ